MSNRTITRRDFLARSATLAAAAGATGCGTFRLPTLGLIRTPRRIKPGEKLNIAAIGIGGKGRTDILALAKENIVALCDVEDAPRNAEDILERYGHLPRYKDYRQMLDEMDDQIDAVTVSTPDHSHFPAAMKAIEMGKHIFVQKPLTHSIWEVRKMAQAARRHRVATQMGNQHHADEGPRLLCEWLQGGVIGHVREVHIWTNRPIWPQNIERPSDTQPVPDSLDWDLWLGPAPHRPYNSAYAPFNWRGWWDFGTGALGDMGCHIMDGPFWSLNLDAPTTVEAVSSEFNDETYPEWSIITYRFPWRDGRPPVKLVWYDGGKMPHRPRELESGREFPAGGGQLYYGDKGVILAGSHVQSPRIIPESKMQEAIPKLPPESIARSPGHYEEWVEACKGGPRPMSNFNYSGPLTETVLLGNIAVRAGRKIEWDAKRLRVTNVPEANDGIRLANRNYDFGLATV